MPLNTALATQIWNRYCWARDHGHEEFVQKADKCERFFRGEQWSMEDLVKLRRARRPALTINKIISTLSNVMGEQIFNRSEITFRPRNDASQDTATVLAKVMKYISDRNQLDWKRSDMFADGAITSRGFLDVRIEFNDSMQGDVSIENLNPKNVIVDPDGEQYDPDTWGEVFTTKWLTADDICVLYSKADGEDLRNREGSFFPYGYDSITSRRDRFGGEFYNPMYLGVYDESSVTRTIRVVERQYRKLDRQKHFLSPETGDTRAIPSEFGRDRIAWFVEKFGFQVITKMVRRIRWTVVADNIVLHDDWSPYKHFTVVPYFPYFRYGTTIGLVENLLGSQELLNKTSSQELHIANTTANSGWKVKTGSLTNMTTEELEERGAETGLVLEFNDKPEDIEKIQPNQVPQGLDRISFKAEEHIKTISGVSDSMQGFDREDVAAKAIQAKRQAGNTNLAKPLDSLVRSDFIFARNVLDLIQTYYTEERVLTITKDAVTGETETLTINQVTPEGRVVNDLSIGQYDVVPSSVPQRETLEDSQFDQAVALKEMGVAIPDEVLIDSSRLLRKKEIIEKINAAKNSPEAQQQQQLALRGQAAGVSKEEADAALKRAKTVTETVKAHKEAATPPEDNGAAAKQQEVEAGIALEDRKFEHTKALDYAELNHKMQLEQQSAQVDMQLKQEQAQTERALRIQAAAEQSSNPSKSTKPTGAKK